MNTRISADLSQLAKVVQKQKDASLNADLVVSIIVPICVGFNKSTDEKRQGHLQDVIAALKKQKYSFQVRLYQNLTAQENVKYWEELNKDGLAVLKKDQDLFSIEAWREKNVSERSRARQVLDELFATYPTTKAEFDKKLEADASSFVGRKPIPANEKAVLLEKAKLYIVEELVDCLASLPNHNSNILNVFLYPDSLYSCMQYILKENAQALQRMPIISANYTIPKQSALVAASSSASSKPVPIVSSSSGSSKASAPKSSSTSPSLVSQPKASTSFILQAVLDRVVEVSRDKVNDSDSALEALASFTKKMLNEDEHISRSSSKSSSRSSSRSGSRSPDQSTSPSSNEPILLQLSPQKKKKGQDSSRLSPISSNTDSGSSSDELSGDSRITQETIDGSRSSPSSDSSSSDASISRSSVVSLSQTARKAVFFGEQPRSESQAHQSSQAPQRLSRSTTSIPSPAPAKSGFGQH